MKEYELKYGCNPNQKPSRIYMEEGELRDYFPEFVKYEPQCRFQGCMHIHEPDCAVKEALAEGKISQLRYDDYLALYEELKEKRRY